MDSPSGSSRTGRESLGGSSSDGSSQPYDGPVWLEDPSPIRRRSLRDAARLSIASDRLSIGGNVYAAASSGQRPMRSDRQAIITFNVPQDRNPNKAIKELIDKGLLGAGTPADIAGFFLLNDGKLDASKLADYLGDAGEVNKLVLRLLLGACDFSGMPMDSALRKMISLTKLPGESQKIDRMLEDFAQRYMECNPGASIDHADTASIMAFSLVMLNVDAHNDNIPQRKKMTEAQYVRNLRGICKDGSSPDEGMLRASYMRVARYEWSVEERAHFTPVHSGVVYRQSSRMMLGGQPSRLHAVLTCRAIYFYREEHDAAPDRYIRLEGLGARRMRSKSGGGAFELFSLKAEAGAGNEVEGRMVKLGEAADGANQPRKTVSRHTSCFFHTEAEHEAALWVQLVRDHTLDDGSLSDDSLGLASAPKQPLPRQAALMASLESDSGGGGLSGSGDADADGSDADDVAPSPAAAAVGGEAIDAIGAVAALAAPAGPAGLAHWSGASRRLSASASDSLSEAPEQPAAAAGSGPDRTSGVGVCSSARGQRAAATARSKAAVAQRGKFSTADSLRMLERKYAGVEKRTTATEGGGGGGAAAAASSGGVDASPPQPVAAARRIATATATAPPAALPPSGSRRLGRPQGLPAVPEVPDLAEGGSERQEEEGEVVVVDDVRGAGAQPVRLAALDTAAAAAGVVDSAAAPALPPAPLAWPPPTASAPPPTFNPFAVEGAGIASGSPAASPDGAPDGAPDGGAITSPAVATPAASRTPTTGDGPGPRPRQPSPEAIPEAQPTGGVAPPPEPPLSSPPQQQPHVSPPPTALPLHAVGASLSKRAHAGDAAVPVSPGKAGADEEERRRLASETRSHLLAKQAERMERRAKADARLHGLLRACGAAEAQLVGLDEKMRRRRAELQALEAGLDEARLDLQRAKAAGKARASELRAQHAALKLEALQTAEASSAARTEAARLNAANADARAQLVATRRLLQQLQGESMEKRARCEELTTALDSAQQLLVQSHAKLMHAEGSLKPPLLSHAPSPTRTQQAGVADASRAIAALLRQTLEGGALHPSGGGGEFAAVPGVVAPGWSPEPARVSERMARVRGRPSSGGARPSLGAGAPPLSASLPLPTATHTAAAAERDLGV